MRAPDYVHRTYTIQRKLNERHEYHVVLVEDTIIVNQGYLVTYRMASLGGSATVHTSVAYFDGELSLKWAMLAD